MDKSDYLDDESKKLGSDSGSSGMYYFRAFPLHAEEYVADVLGSDSVSSSTHSFRDFPLRSGDSVDVVLESDGFTPSGVKYKVGQLLSIFLRSD